MDKYYIDIETMYTQGTGCYYMISSDKTNIEMLRMELLKKLNILNILMVAG